MGLDSQLGGNTKLHSRKCGKTRKQTQSTTTAVILLNVTDLIKIIGSGDFGLDESLASGQTVSVDSQMQRR
jgi:hypothetical protein